MRPRNQAPLRRWSTRCLVALSIAASPCPALADSPAGDAALAGAREAFAAAELDEDGGLWADALAKLRQVAAVRLTAGVRYHVALCEERMGQLAEALRDYASAERDARAEGARDVLELVGARIADVGARAPRLTVRLPPGAAGAAVSVDGEAAPDAPGGAPIALDPGPHRVEASAPGRAPSGAVVTLREGDRVSIDLSLAPTPPPSPPAEPPAREPPRRDGARRRLRATPLVAGAGALVLAGAGVAAFVEAGAEVTAGARACLQLTSAAPGACDAEKNAVRAWDWAAAAAWAGAVAGAAIAVLSWARARDGDGAGPAPGPSARLVVGPGAVGLAGRF